MRSRLAVVLFLLVHAKSLVAQTERQLLARSPAVAVSVPAALCDGAEVRRAKYRGNVGNGLLLGSLAVDGYGVSANRITSARAISFLGAGVGIAIVGMHLHWTP